METRITWRVTCPINRDAVVLQVLKYEWEPDSSSHSFRPTGRSYLLVLEPEPHWQEYQPHETLPEDGTVLLDGLSLVQAGVPRNQWPTPFDPRQALADRMDFEFKRVLQAVTYLEPAVTFDAPPS